MATTTIGTFLVRLAFDDGSFEKDSKTAEQRIQSFGKSLSSMAGVIDSIVVGALKAGAASMAAFGAASIKVGADFEQAITTVGAVAGASAEDLAALSEQARKLGASTAFSATEAATGMQDLARAGLKTPEIIAASESALLLAGASASEMSDATAILASTMAQFNLDASESGRISDVFASAMNNSQLSMSSLTEAMKFAGVTGAGFGMTLEETTAAVAMFRNLGLQGSMAGNAFKMAMLEASKANSKKEATLRRLGLTMADINPQTRTFAEIMQAVGDAGMSASDAATIFGARAGLAVAQVAKGFADQTTDFSTLLATLESSAGSTEETYARMTNTVSGQFAIVRSATEELLLSVFDTFGAGDNSLSALLSEIAETIAFVAAEFQKGSGTLAASFRENIASAIDFLRNNREAIARTFIDFVESVRVVVVELAKIIPLLDDIGRLIATVFVANKVRAFVAALVSFVTMLRSAVLTTGSLKGAIRLLYAELVVMSGGTLALVAAIGVLVIGLLSLVSANDDAAASEERLRAAQEKRRKESEEAEAEALSRATALQGRTAAVTLALADRLAGEDRLTQSLERQLSALAELSSEQVKQGLATGELIEATIDGERVVLDYATALEMARMEGEEAEAANTAIADSFQQTGTAIFEAEGELSALLAVQGEYNRLVEQGSSGVRGASYAFEQVADSVEDYRTKLEAAQAEVDRLREKQATQAQTLDRLGRKRSIENKKEERRLAREKERNRERGESEKDLLDAYLKTLETRQKAIAALERETLKLEGNRTAIVQSEIATRVASISKVFDAEIAAARKAGKEVASIEQAKQDAIEQIRANARAKEAADTDALVESYRASAFEIVATEEERLRETQRKRREAFAREIADEMAAADATAEARLAIVRRQAAGLSRLRALDAAENTALEEKRRAEAKQTADAVVDFVRGQTEAVGQSERRRFTRIGRFLASRKQSEKATADRIEQINRETDRFLIENTDLTAEQRREIEASRVDAISEIEKQGRAEQRKGLLSFLGEIGKGTVKAVATVSRGVAKVAKSAGKALGGIFSAFTGGLSVADIAGGIQEAADAVASGEEKSAEAASRNFVDGLLDGAMGFLDTLVSGLPVIIERLGERLPEVFAGVAEAIPQVVDAVAANIGPVIDAIVAGIPMILQGIVDAVPVLVDALVTFLSEDLPRLLEVLGPIVGELIAEVLGAIPTIVDAIVAAFPNLVSLLVSAVEQILAEIPAIIQSILQAVTTILPTLFAGIGDIIAAVFDAIPLIIDAILSELPNLIGALVSGVLSVVTRIIEELPTIIDAIFALIPQLIEALLLAVAQIVTAVFEALPRIIAAIVRLIPSLITGVIELVPTILEALINALPALLSALITGTIGAIPQIIFGVISALPDIIVALLDGLVNGLIVRLPFLVVELIAALIKGIIDGIKGFVDAFRRIFKEALGFVGDLFGKDDKGDGFFKRTGKAIANGAKSAWNAVTGVFNDTPGVIKAGSKPYPATFAPGDLIVAAKEPTDLVRMALSSMAGSARDALSGSLAAPRTPPPMPTPSNGSRGSSGTQAAPIDIAVVAEGRVLDAVQVTAMDRGRAPKMESKIRKASGVKVGLDRGRFNRYSG